MSTESEWKEYKNEILDGDYWLRWDDGEVKLVHCYGTNACSWRVTHYCRATPPPLPKEEKAIEAWVVVNSLGDMWAFGTEAKARISSEGMSCRIVKCVDPAPLEAKIAELKKQIEESEGYPGIAHDMLEKDGRIAELEKEISALYTELGKKDGKLATLEKDLSQRVKVARLVYVREGDIMDFPQGYDDAVELAELEEP